MTTIKRPATPESTTRAEMLRREMIAGLVSGGAIRSPWVREAFGRVPREVFVPRFHRWVDGRQVLVDRDDPDLFDEWLCGVYTDQVLTVQLTPAGDVVDPAGLPTSSSSMPTVMAGMLEALDLQPGHRVLEIGTGTGYNTALLAQRVGDGNVTSVELDPRLAEGARNALGEMGLYPQVHVGDGAAGVPFAGRWDRIIATASADHIPPTWVEQLAPGGVIVTNLRGSLAGGVVRLTGGADTDEVAGPFLPMQAAFMPMRTRLASPHRDGEDWNGLVLDMRNPQVGRTALDPAILDDRSFRFLLQLHLAGHRVRGFAPRLDMPAIVSGSAIDGSWVEVDTIRTDTARSDVEFPVRQGGPLRLWDTVEAAHATWQRLGRPDPTRFTVVAGVDVDLQHIRHPNGDHEWRWPLPL